MWNQIFALTWKDLKIFFKDRGHVVLIFLQPMMFIILMSYALTGAFQSGKDHPIRLLAVNEDRGKQAGFILRQLDELKSFRVEKTWDGQPMTRQKAEKLIKGGERNMAFIFPPDFSDVLEQSPASHERKRTKILVIVDPATPSQFVEPVLGTLQGYLERTMYTAMMPKGIDYLFEHIVPQTPAWEKESFKSRAEEAISGGLTGKKEPLVTVEQSTPAGMRVQKFPDTFQQNVPGYTIYGIFWIVSLLAGSVLLEKREGTFRRLLTAPLDRAVMLAGKGVPYYIINLMQIVLMIGVSAWLFGMNLGSSISGLIAVSLVAAATSTALGIMIAALARTEAQVGGLTVLLLLSLSALGGCFIPRFTMPQWLRMMGLITPHAWALDAYQDLLVRGYNFLEVLPKIGALGAFAIVFLGIGIWRFRFE